MANKSIYEMIYEKIDSKGRLPQDFTLPNEKTNGYSRTSIFGAGYGDTQYYNQNFPLTTDLVDKLQIACASLPDDNTKLFNLINKYGVKQILDTPGFCKNFPHIYLPDISPLIKFGESLAFQSDEIELVKFGLWVMSIKFYHSCEIYNKLEVLALHEEFTVYVVAILREIEFGYKSIFRIAKKVYGHGRIWAIEYLELDIDETNNTEEIYEIRNWILRYGISGHEYFHEGYYLRYAEKGNLIGTLQRGDMDQDIYNNIGTALSNISKKPFTMLYKYKYASEALLLFSQYSEKYALTFRDIFLLISLEKDIHSSKLQNKDQICLILRNTIENPKWENLICEALSSTESKNDRDAIDLADTLKMNSLELLYSIVKKNPIKYVRHISLIYKKPEFANDLTTVYQSVLPLLKLATGMGNIENFETLVPEYRELYSVLKELGKYPNLGESIVQTALSSPVIPLRKMACSVVEKWMKKCDLPLEKLSMNLYFTLKNVSQIELNPQIKKMMSKMLCMKKR